MPRPDCIKDIDSRQPLLPKSNMRIFGILAVVFITNGGFLCASADLVEPPSASAVEPFITIPRQSTIPGLLEGGNGVGRRQTTGECCGAGKLIPSSQGRFGMLIYSISQGSCCSLGSSCCNDGKSLFINIRASTHYRLIIAGGGCCPILYVPLFSFSYAE